MTPAIDKRAETETIQVYLVDDHPIVRESLRDMLNATPDIVVTGQAAGYDEALALFGRGVPAVGIINLSLAQRSGLALIKELKTAYPHARLLVLSMHDERLYAARALRAGARGYLMKTEPPNKIEEAVRQIHAGQLVVSSRVHEQLLAETAGLLDDFDRKVHLLTDNELKVLEHMGKGMAAIQIADALKTTPQAMRGHYDKMKAKMGYAHLRDLARAAHRFVHRYEL
jgi:DNA-binding NarL/FixJ family response regulator